MQAITPVLWFNLTAEEAANFYVATFPNSRILTTTWYGEGAPVPAGTVLTVDFELDGLRLQALNGGPGFEFTEAVSLAVPVETQDEVDRLWETLIADGGAPSQCGWLKDKFGFSWQIVPKRLIELMGDEDREAAGRVLTAMLQMTKIEIPLLEAAYRG